VSFDYVIAGAGSAGCVLANRLTENGRYRVLLLEAGPPDTNPWLHIPIGYAKTMFHPVLNWGFHAEPAPGLDGRRIYTPRGRTLGGSSAINGLIQIRGQPEDFDGWAASGATGWSWNDTLPYFIRSETNSRGADAFHGDKGPLAVSDIRDRHVLVDAMIEGAAEMGIPRNDDFNGPSQEGAGYLQLTTRNGWRCSAATAYLKPVRGRANLVVETGAHATRVLFDGTRATGIEYLHGGNTRSVSVAREVILAAGAIQSPQLLQLSGVGPAALLQSLGIPVVADLPGAGENLQDHLILRILYKCTRPVTTNDDLRNPLYKVKTGLRWLLQRRGPMAVGVMMGGMITRALPDSRTPDYQFFLSTVSAEDRGAKPHPWSGFTFNYYPLRPTSRGHVRITSREPKAAPAMQFNYLSTDEDRRQMLAGMKLTRRLAATKAFSPYVASEYKPGSGVQTEDEMLGYIRSAATTGFHPCGTCRMGSDNRAAVDPQLRVRGVQGLRVIDASVMPTVVSGNTNAATIMIAEKGADLVLQDATAAA
jgi:choline dehydrogenase